MSNIAYGKLAAEFGFEVPVTVCKSGGGYYIGTFLSDPSADFSGPLSRESEEYYDTETEAQNALNDNTWTQRQHL
ncbi:hypothetical protein AGJ33_20135 [Cronobacter dublinensis subsp. dublinensis]|nr:hypothetical protein [Cronobacter dublinensis subsp. dublinensis]